MRYATSAIDGTGGRRSRETSYTPVMAAPKPQVKADAAIRDQARRRRPTDRRAARAQVTAAASATNAGDKSSTASAVAWPTISNPTRTTISTKARAPAPAATANRMDSLGLQSSRDRATGASAAFWIIAVACLWSGERDSETSLT